MKIKPAKHLQGTLKLPGDKSISHRAALLGAMATGETKIEGFAASADCASTIDCLQKLGIEVRREKTRIFVKGVVKTGFQKPSQNLDCGNSGTTLRLLAGILAGQNFGSVLRGDASLQKRPMQRIIEPLTQMGAKIEPRNGRAPLEIQGKNPLQAISYKMNIASAQVKSCVLLAGLNAQGKTTIQSPKTELRIPSSRNHTELMLSYLGADLEENFLEFEDGFAQEISINGDSKLTARDLQIPSDISSAAFFLVAASCLKGSELILKNVGLNPTRRAVIDVLQSFGAEIEILDEREICNEIVGDLRVCGRRNFAPKFKTNKIDGDVIANLIDEIPILAIFGTQLENGLEIRNAQELRVKESDRIKAIVENLRRMNADVEEFADGLRVGKSDLKGAQVDAYGDHRIAMAFAIAALFADGETRITGAEYASVSFPEFFQTLSSVAK